MKNTYRSPRELFWTAALVLVLSPLFRFSWDLAPQTFFHLLIAGILCFVLARYRITVRLLPEIPLVLFLAIAVFSFLSAADRSIARNELFILFDALAFLSLFSFLSKEDKKRLLLIPPVIGLGLTTAMLVFFIYSPENRSFGQLIPAEAVVNVNAAAGFLVLAFILSLIPVSNTPRMKGVTALPFILFAGILITRSRTAIVAASAGAAFYAWPYLSSRLRRILGVAAIACLMLVAYITVLKHTGSLSSRMIWWQAAARMAIDHPLTGIGWGNYGVFYLSYRAQPALNTLYAHNVFLQIAAESGLPGLVTFLLVIVSFIRLRLSGNRTTPEVRASAVAGAAFIVFSMLDFSFYLPAHLFVLAACAGTLYERSAEPRESRLMHLLYGSAFLLWALTVIPPFAASRWYARGVRLQKEGNATPAAAAYVRALHLDPLSPAPFSKYAELLFGLYSKDHGPALLNRAISLQEDAVHASPVTAALWSDLAWLYTTADKNEDALRALRQAVHYDPFNTTYRNGLLRLSKTAEPAP